MLFTEHFHFFHTSLPHHFQPRIFPQCHTLIVTIGFLHRFKGLGFSAFMLLAEHNKTLAGCKRLHLRPPEKHEQRLLRHLGCRDPFSYASAREQKWSQPDANGTKWDCVISEAMRWRRRKALKNKCEEGGDVRGPISPFLFSICCFSHSNHPLCVTLSKSFLKVRRKLARDT